MLISEFAKKTDLTPDAVRFYVRLGLLKPTTGSKGGNRPYQIFSEKHVETVGLIRMQQSLGLPLREIAELLEENAAGRLTPERSRAVLEAQLKQLQERRAHIDRMIAYVSDKLAWIEEGSGPPPRFDRYTRCGH
jgi:MerR family transcriptional regulator, copper efflux regulator